ncbi:hypothetical protein [Streptomyces sporangiiformans]|uniref:DUF8017 domain-containing protein n=1 Tax=Streptomyces sporangiiformans TaxID=2315329 RepID=A0A505D4Q9_9ACTN|nr:hypothetical protein [Streptomyces sporangiiformans]TPQ16655.1 hypothetical protein FGD71_040510 [Streptomyces sporangiiformans]
MWPGQQPPGGEQNPQDPNQNPYQQPGYQQPNPYQQPGFQQPNPYAQQPGQQGWATPADPLGAPQVPQGGGDNKRTKIVAIVAASAVVVAAGVTGFLVLGGDKDDTAKDPDKKGPAATASASKKPSASASGDADNPRGSSSEKPTVPGWKVVVNPRFGTKFDVPAEWELDTADTSVGFEWEEKGKTDRTTVTAPAYLKSKWCTDDDDKDGRDEDTALVTAGTRGENGAKNTNEAAETRVPWWIFGGYTQPDKKSVKFSKPKAYATASGLKGSVATSWSENTPQNGKCDSEGKAITFAFKNGAGDFVTWNLFGAKGVDGEIPEATIQKILATVRLTDTAPTDS